MYIPIIEKLMVYVMKLKINGLCMISVASNPSFQNRYDELILGINIGGETYIHLLKIHGTDDGRIHITCFPVPKRYDDNQSNLVDILSRFTGK
jgi:hypothetical protein